MQISKIDPEIRALIIKKFVIRVIWTLIRTVILTGLAFIIIYPILYMISIAFRPVAEMFDPAVVWIPKSFTVDNMKMAIEKMNLFNPALESNSLMNTFLLDVVSAVLQVIFASTVGYGFARYDFKGNKILFAMVILTMIVPINSIIIPTYINYSALGIVDRLASFYIPAIFGMGIRAGFSIYIFRQFFKGMPKELEDAAAIDGCGFIRTFIQIFVPNAKSAYLTVFLFSIVWYWNDFYYSYMFFPKKQTVSIALSNLRSVLNQSLDVTRDPYVILTIMQAGCLLSVIPLLLFYLVLQRQFTESIERTGIVG